MREMIIAYLFVCPNEVVFVITERRGWNKQLHNSPQLESLNRKS